QHAVTYYFVVPPIILALANASIDLSKLKSVRFIFSGGAPMALEPARKLQEKTGITVVQGYGMTEASPLTHSQPYPIVRMASVGMPIHNTEQKIVDMETGEREVPAGTHGEIIVRGPQIMKGYWKAAEETARVLRDGWFYTGDIGHVDEDGFTYIVDRKKEMIKYKGFGVAPAELESLLLEHPAIMDAAVIGIPDEEAGELIKGYVVMRKEHTATADDIIAFANAKLAGYKKIHYIEFTDAIPKNASGKILRRELKERERAKRQL
ncbi:MAG: AMP-binding protein, partial [Ktedonobacteraceae bacterium]|nr:AMP-binding protein [Ktedonobacteraceae bacterium]